MSDKRQLGLFGPGDGGDEKGGNRGEGAKARRRKPRPSVLAPIEPAPVAPDLAEAAAALPAHVRLGTSSWAFPGWSGLVYGARETAKRLSAEGLAAYARHPLLRAVGLDRTHYAPLTREQFAAHAAQVPASFRFLVKAHEECTLFRFPEHPRYGARRGAANPVFLDADHAAREVVGPALAGLGETLGVLLFQVAPQDLRPIGGPDAFVEQLHAFLRALPRGPLYAVELRNDELLTGGYAAALADAGAVHCASAHPRMPPLAEQCARAGVDRAPHLVVRWMLNRALDYAAALERYEPFDRLVDEDPATRLDVARLAAAAAPRARDITIIVNNKAEGSSPLSVFKLAAEIAREIAGILPAIGSAGILPA